MSSIQPVSIIRLSHEQPKAGARSSDTRAAGQPAGADTPKTPANKAVRDMVTLLDEAVRHPESLQDSTPAYQDIPLSRDEMKASWHSHAC